MGVIRSIKNIVNGLYSPLREKLKLHYRPKQYIKKWGKATGLALYNDFFNYTTVEEETRFKIPDYPFDIYLRKGTSDEPTLRQVFMNIRYEMDLPFQPKTILDGGANVGYASVFFAQKYPEAEILAVEPDSSNFLQIEKNTKHYQNIKALKSAIWGVSTHLKISNPNFEKWAFVVEEAKSDDAESFQAYSITDLMKSMQWNSIDFLKLDIEGAEASVFKNDFESWLPNVKVLVIELHEKMRPGCTEIFEKAISKYSFEKSVSGENLVYINRNVK